MLKWGVNLRIVYGKKRKARHKAIITSSKIQIKDHIADFLIEAIQII